MRRLGPVGSFILLALLVAWPVRSAVTVARGGERELVLIGFAVFHTNLSEQLEGFFDASDQLPAEFTNRQVLNLRMDGDLKKGVAVESRVQHDREGLRDWRYYARISGERSSLAVGELDGAFRETSLTRYDTPFYGVEGKLGVGRFTASGFATLRKGNLRVDRLRGGNVSGPYVLSASPILEGSERIAFEVRDRRDEERLLHSDAKVRGSDYLIDYFAGTIQFDAPVASETFDGDPILIVIEYEFEARAGGDTDYLGGSRLVYEPVKGVSLGATYLRATGDNAGALSRDGLVGFDQKLNLGRWLAVSNEMAGPGARVLDREQGAWRLGVQAKPVKGVEVRGRYRRVGRSYETLADPRLDTELDREEWEIDTSFLPTPEHRLTGGYGVRSNNVLHDPAVDTSRTRSLFLGWEARIPEWPILRARWERRVSDDGNSSSFTSRLDTWSLDGERDLGRLPLFGRSKLKAQYRFEQESRGGETAIGSGARRTHGVRMRLDGRPIESLEAFVEAREAWTAGGDGGATSRTGEFLVGGRLRLGSHLATGASLRFGSDRNGEASAHRHTLLFDLRWEPSDRLRTSLRYEWTLASSGGADTNERNLYGQLAVEPVRGLTASAGYLLDDRADSLGAINGNVDGEYFASLLYKHGDRLTLFARAERGFNEERLPPLAPTRAIRETRLFGASWAFTPQWAVLAEVKDERLRDAALARRRAAVVELSRSLGNLLRLGVGLELTLDEHGASERLDRQRFYMKLVGQL